jgi:hypothetical protein
MKKLISLLVLVPLGLLAQPTPPPSASQAEVNAGLLKNKYVSPLTLAGFPGISGPTNGITATTASNIVAQNNAASATAGSSGMTNRWKVDATNAAKGLQTPWLHTIDAANFSLTNLHGITLVSSASISAPGATLTMLGGALNVIGGGINSDQMTSGSYDFINDNDGAIITVQDGVGMSFTDIITPDFWFGTVSAPGADGRLHGIFYGDGSHLNSIGTNAIDSTFYLWVASGAGSGGQTPWSQDINANGKALTNLGSISLSGGTDTNAYVIATGGGSVILTNPATGANMVMPPSGPVTASGGFDIGTNTGSVTIQGDITVSNTIIAVASYIPTNNAPAHTLWIGESHFTTNASFTITGVDRILAAMYNYGVLHVFNTGGSIITITPPTAWHIIGTWNVTNGGSTIISGYVGPAPGGGFETNAICFPQK